MNTLTTAEQAPDDLQEVHVQQTRRSLRDNYWADRRPWVIAFSGGKDSTLVLQLVYELLFELGETATKPVHIVASDTRVEAPNIEDYLDVTLGRIATGARESGLPVHVHRVMPEIENSFWSNLIGKGYPSPTRWFRWCTTKMKIKPARKVIETIAAEHGSVVLLLGTRTQESSSRSQHMEARESNSRGLNPHHEIPNALVATPIATWTNDQVWEYLFEHNPPPWGGNHDFMLNLYRQASGGECPVVLDLNTPSCGGSRFGCWTCTVVKMDRSMHGFIESGETWMRPLNEFRSWLKDIRDKPEMRMPYRRDQSKGPGPFTPEVRQQILTRLLETERKVEGRRLIGDDEIAHIQSLWIADFDSTHSALKIAARYGREIKTMKPRRHAPIADQALLQQLILDHEIQEAWVEDLLYLVTEKYPSLEAHGSKKQLLDDIQRVIENAVRQQDAAAPSA